jgi:hypothetical protein
MSVAEKQITAFEASLQTVVKRLQATILLDAGKGGYFAPDYIKRSDYANSVYTSLTDMLRSSGYYDSVRELIDGNPDLVREVKANRATRGLPKAFTKTSTETAKALDRLGSDQFSMFQGMAEKSMLGIKDALVQFAYSGMSEDAFIEMISTSVESQLAKYATTYATTSRAEFIQAVEYEAAKDYDGELFWEYVGPDDDRLRPACEIGIGAAADTTYSNAPYFTDDERIRFEAEFAEERQWNCRHTFQQITQQDYEENTK